MDELKIDPKLQDLLPPLSPHEEKELRESLKKNGPQEKSTSGETPSSTA